MTLTASATGHADGTDTIDVTDDDVAQLSLQIAAASISEGDGPIATMATVSRNTDTTSELIVTLASNDTSEATIPAVGSAVTIAAGQSTSAAFNIDAVDDVLIDGTQTVTITASASAHADGTDTLDVTDDDVPEITIVIAADSVSENAGAGATTAIVSRNTDTTEELLVTLASNDTTEATVQTNITIAAGQSSSAPFNIDSIDDGLIDGTQIVTITASASGHDDGTDILEVSEALSDDAAPMFFVVPLPNGKAVVFGL